MSIIKKPLVLISLLLLSIFLLLSFKNPYTTRTLVPNLEPYPDSLYYSVPAWNLVHGKGFSMEAYGYKSKIVTPPVYSLYLAPFFAIFRDVRSFYFANLLLMTGSVIIFIGIIVKLFNRKKFDLLIIGSLGFYYVTNFYLYTLPSLLMAESITMFVSIVGVYLLISETSKNKSMLAGGLGMIILLVKFSNVPITAAFYLLYGYKLINKKEKRYRPPFILALMATVLIPGLYIIKTQIFMGHKNLSGSAGFSLAYFLQNFWSYLKIIFGQPERFLWFGNRMTNTVLTIPALFGIVVGLKSSSRRNILSLLILGVAVITFMSFFYTRDIRYVMVIYPIFLIFIGTGFVYLKNRFGDKVCLATMILMGMVYLLLPSVSQISGERAIITLKKQVGLNFRHSEEPWNYNALIEFNSYFKEKKDKKPYLGTLLPPYFVRFYSNDNYNYLPVSMGQEFFGDKQDNTKVYLVSLGDYYKDLLKEGNDIYVSPYYQANLASWKTDYESLISNFEVTLVRQGCYDTCNIYRLKLKE